MKHFGPAGAAALLFSLGALSVLAQIILFREISFLAGSAELVAAAMLACWLLAGSLGAFAGSRLAKTFPPAVLLGACALVLPAEIFAVRLVRGLLAGRSGELPSLIALLILCSLVAAPLPAILGFAFPPAAGRLGRRGAARAYVFETAGLAAGAFLALALVTMGREDAAAALIGSLFILSAVLVSTRPRALALVSLLPLALAVSGAWGALDRATVEYAFRAGDMVNFASTPYGRAFSAHRGGETRIFSAGLSETPLPEADELVELALAVKSDPASVLVICGDPSGFAVTFGTLSGVRADIISPDPGMLEFRMKEKPFDVPPNVNLLSDEPLHFLWNSTESYGLVIVSLGAPVSAGGNRFFTLEFFELLKKKMADGGVLAVKMPYSPGHVSGDLLALNGSVWKTLGDSFEFRRAALPRLSGSLLIIASSSGFAEIAPSPPPGRGEARKKLGIYSPLDYDGAFFSLRTRSAADALMSGNWPVNTISGPVSCRYAISYCQRRFGGPGALAWIWKLGLLHWVVAAGALGVLLLILSRAVSADVGAYSASFGGGFCSMAAQVILIYVFQNSQGVLYSHLGLLAGAFMLGALAGANVFRRKNSAFYPAILLLSLAALTGALPHILGAFALSSRFVVIYLAFPATCAACGFLTGALFPSCANRVSGRNAGIVYASDLSGACIGALFSGLVLIPAFGLGSAALAVSLTGVFLALPMLPAIIGRASIKNPAS